MASAIDTLPSGEVIVVGENNNSNLFIQKLTKEGTVLLNRQHTGFAVGSVADMKILNNNQAIVAGTMNDNVTFGWLELVNLQTGNYVWRKYIPANSPPVNGSNPYFYLSGVTVGQGGDIYVVGHVSYELRSAEGFLRDSMGAKIMKFNSSGTLLWQKDFGQSDEWLTFSDVTVSNEGQLMAVGIRLHYDPAVKRNAVIYKIDPTTGSLLSSQDTLGGGRNNSLNNIIKTEDSYVLAGSEYAYPEANIDNTVFWVRKIDFSGNVIWDKKHDLLADVDLYTMKKDGDGFIAVGAITSYPQKAVVVKFDATGNLIAIKGFTLSEYHRHYDILPLGGNEYLLACRLDGTLNGKEVISTSHAAVLIKFGFNNAITGSVFLDLNGNNIKDAGESYLNKVLVTSKSDSEQKSSFTTDGRFTNFVSSGNFVTSVQIDTLNYTVTPSTDTSIFSDFFTNDTVHFAVSPTANSKDLNVRIDPILPARPGFSTTYKVTVNNASANSILAVTVKIVKAAKQTFESNSAFYQVKGDTIIWQVNTLAGLESKSINVFMRNAVPPNLNNGDTLKVLAIVEPTSLDATPEDNQFLLKQIAQGSFDPNDKTELNNGVYTTEQLAKKGYLQYVIRFQNTGTDTAFRIIVRDTLDSKLSWNSFEMLSASHPFQMSIKDGNKIEWVFDDILLPYSAVNEPASHGYIVYRIRPNNDLALGQVVHNTASIYFDFNLPIVTNDAATTHTNNFLVLPFTLIHFGAVANNMGTNIIWKVEDDKDIDHYEVERSTDGVSFEWLGTVQSQRRQGASTFSLKDEQVNLKDVVYYKLKIVHSNGKVTYSKIVSIKPADLLRSAVYPNPVTGIDPTISITASISTELKVLVYNAYGQVVLTQSSKLNRGSNSIVVDNFTALPSGVYTIRLESSLGSSVHKINLVGR